MNLIYFRNSYIGRDDNKYFVLFSISKNCLEILQKDNIYNLEIYILWILRAKLLALFFAFIATETDFATGHI